MNRGTSTELRRSHGPGVPARFPPRRGSFGKPKGGRLTVRRNKGDAADELHAYTRHERWDEVLTVSVAAETLQTAAASTVGRRPRAGAEAARYGVLRRLAPALKHDMVVNLQAISMMAEVLNARLERGSPSPAEFQSSISKLNRLARDAVMSCLKVAAWIEPGEDEGVRLAQGIDECIALLATNFNFRGFSIVRELPESDFQVWRMTLRNLLVAALMALTDAAPGPSEVRVKAEVQNGFAEISVRLAPRRDEFEAIPIGPTYRQLDWADVQALAAAESVELVRGPDQIVMRVPRAVATAPIGVAPI